MELWFDDGRIEIYDVAYPLIKKHNLTGILALVGEWIGKEGFMNSFQINSMIMNGWKIANHSLNHDDQTKLGEFSYDDMFGNMRNLWAFFGVQPIAYVFPYNKFTPELKQEAINICGAVREVDVPHYQCDGWYWDKETVRIKNAQNPSQSQFELERLMKLLDGLRRR